MIRLHLYMTVRFRFINASCFILFSVIFPRYSCYHEPSLVRLHFRSFCVFLIFLPARGLAKDGPFAVVGVSMDTAP